MPHLAPAASLLLALCASAFASTYGSHAGSHPHRTAAPAARHQHAVAASGSHRHARAADFLKASLARPHKGRQIAQPAHLAHAAHTRHPRLERTAHSLSEHSARHFSRLQLTAARPLPVVAVIRSTTEHPRLPDIAEAITEPTILPQLYDARGHLQMPAALVGSHAILLHQNEMADLDGLGRVQNDADLDAMRQRGMLVSLPTSIALTTDDRLPYNRRYTRPWTASFLNDLARAHYAHFHTPLQVNSAVRTVQFQQRLLHINGNAAPADGDTASPHLTGQAIDLAKRGMPLAEIAWMRGYLLPLIESGKIDVEEEFQQSCFHISVYRRYASSIAEHYNVASRDGSSPLTSTFR